MSAASFQARVEDMGVRFGAAPAQFYVASGDPEGEAVETSFRALADDVRRRAMALSRLGITRADRVSLMTPLGLNSAATLIGTMIAATAAPLNYFLEASALVRLIEAAGSKTLIVARRFDDDPAVPDKVEAIRAALPLLRIIAYGDGPEIAGAIDFDAELTRAPDNDWLAEHRASDPDRVLALFHTGGTTGRPKLVPHTEAMYLAMLGASAEAMGTTEGNRILGGLPLFHTSGALQAGIVPLLNGCGVIIPSSAGFRAPGVIPNYWNFVARFGVTIGGSVPTILATVSSIKPVRDISSLRHVLCGAAPLPRTTIEAIAELTGGAGVLEGWGMTETCGFSVLNPQGATRLGSVGIPFVGVETQIRALGDGHAELATDEIGELVIRGDIVITHYADDRPDSFTSDGWLRTGDLARKDSDGYLYIVGRAKDIIIRGGHNIDPAIIETPAYEHPAVELAGAVGRPDRYAGELPILFVQLRPGAEASPEDLLDFVQRRIHERAAVPKAVHIVAAMPLSGPGKIHKVSLRQEAIRATLQDELDASGEFAPESVCVTVVDDDLAGIAVKLTGVAEACSLAEQAFKDYPFKIIMGAA
jgi:fatty-acyl-CoA synthase